MTARRLRWIEVATLATGAPLLVPVHEVDGGAAGPCLGVSALLHGDEVTGPEVVRRVLDGVDPENLRGRLRLVPVANPLAFQTLTRVTPGSIEISNLNRVFPADPTLDLAARLAHALQTQFLDEITHLVDLHAGGTFPIVRSLPQDGQCPEAEPGPTTRPPGLQQHPVHISGRYR